MRTKHRCVLIHIRNKGEVGAVEHFKYTPPVTNVSCLSSLYCKMPVPCSHVATCWERADLLALWCIMFFRVFITFPYGVLGQMWYLIVLLPDICLLSYFLFKNKARIARKRIYHVRNLVTHLAYRANANKV